MRWSPRLLEKKPQDAAAFTRLGCKKLQRRRWLASSAFRSQARSAGVLPNDIAPEVLELYLERTNSTSLPKRPGDEVRSRYNDLKGDAASAVI